MANNGNNWNSFMQSSQMQTILYGICVMFCVIYAIDGIRELMSPERSANMIQMMGAPGYYAMIIIRTIVLFATAIAFGRIALKNYKDQKE